MAKKKKPFISNHLFIGNVNTMIQITTVIAAICKKADIDFKPSAITMIAEGPTSAVFQTEHALFRFTAFIGAKDGFYLEINQIDWDKGYAAQQCKYDASAMRYYGAGFIDKMKHRR